MTEHTKTDGLPAMDTPILQVLERAAPRNERMAGERCSPRSSEICRRTCLGRAGCPYGRAPACCSVNLPLALNSNLHSDRPDNLLRVILRARTRRARNRFHAFVPLRVERCANRGTGGLHAAAFRAGQAAVD
jgi:hypothetical protein